MFTCSVPVLEYFFLCIPCWSYCVSMYQVCIKDFLVLFSWFPIGSIFRLFWHWLWNVLVNFACIWLLNLDYDSWICHNKALRLYTCFLSLTTHYKHIFSQHIIDYHYTMHWVTEVKQKLSLTNHCHTMGLKLELLWVKSTGLHPLCWAFAYVVQNNYLGWPSPHRPCT